MRKLTNKKWIAAVLVVVALVATLVTGCGSGSSDNSNNSNNNAADNAGSNTEVRTVKLAFAAFAPFISYNEDGEPEGYEYDLIKKAIDNLPQYELEVEATEWDSVLTGLDAGIYDLSVGCIFHNEEREEKYYFSEPLAANRMILLVHEDNDSLKTLDDLAGKKTQVNNGSIQGLAYEDYNKKYPDKAIDLDYSSLDFTSVLNGVVDGTYDFRIVDIIGWIQDQKTFGDLPLKVVDLPDEDLQKLGIDSNTYVLYSKTDENKQLVEDINNELKKFAEDGTIKELSEKYFGEDLTPNK